MVQLRCCTGTGHPLPLVGCTGYLDGILAGAVCCRLERLTKDSETLRLYIMTLGVLAAYRRLRIGVALATGRELGGTQGPSEGKAREPLLRETRGRFWNVLVGWAGFSISLRPHCAVSLPSGEDRFFDSL